MKIARLPLQSIALLFQTNFFVATIRLFIFSEVKDYGYSGRALWFMMLFTLVLVAMSEVPSVPDAIFFALSKHSVYSFVYIGVTVLTIGLFCRLAYYSDAGTVVCVVMYLGIYVLRIINLVQNLKDVFKRPKATPTL